MHVLTVFVFVFSHEDLLLINMRKILDNSGSYPKNVPSNKDLLFFLFSNLLAASDKVSKSAL